MNREQILAGAKSILESGKYSSLTVDALARSLRMSKSTLYKYFQSKEDVVIDLVREACELADGEIERTINGGTAEQQLVELAAILGRQGERLPRAVLTEPEKLPVDCGTRLADTRELFSDVAHHLIERGVAAGYFKHEAPRVVAVAFVAAAQAVLADQARTGQEKYSEAMAHLPPLFLNSIRAK